MGKTWELLQEHTQETRKRYRSHIGKKILFSSHS
ncbi:hypothetical protein OIU76_003012 [Salix suchowensis]|nr:hypothetical protein OIU76_003012 [Salix suchowensis]